MVDDMNDTIFSAYVRFDHRAEEIDLNTWRQNFGRNSDPKSLIVQSIVGHNKVCSICGVMGQ